MKRVLAAEFIGTALLLATVVGSGIMGERLAQGNVAIALLANALATGAALFVLISIFAPISGAHFNPAVTLVALLRREIALAAATASIAVQVAGAVAGVGLAHLMFDLPIVQHSTTARTGLGQVSAEVVATCGLILTIIGTVRAKPASVPAAVGCYIFAAYWFTSSTSFANPAVTLARSFTNTFAGIQAEGVLPFVFAQLLGALIGFAIAALLWPETRPEEARQPASQAALNTMENIQPEKRRVS